MNGVDALKSFVASIAFSDDSVVLTLTSAQAKEILDRLEANENRIRLANESIDYWETRCTEYDTRLTAVVSNCKQYRKTLRKIIKLARLGLVMV